MSFFTTEDSPDGNASRVISDRLYRDFRKSIITLELKPGDPINIRTIESNLGVSRSPVRDALLKLEKEGLVDIMPQKGTCVSLLNLARMKEERFLRQSLEQAALESLVPVFPEELQKKIEEILSFQKHAASVEDFVAFLEYDDAFHHVFFEGMKLPICWEIIRSMSGHYRRFRLLILSASNVIDALYEEHCQLYQAVLAHNTQKACSILKSHINRIGVDEKDLVERFPHYFTTKAWVPSII